MGSDEIQELRRGYTQILQIHDLRPQTPDLFDRDLERV
jgi:hypothetical protein